MFNKARSPIVEIVSSALLASVALTGCSEQPPKSVTECFLTQPNLIGATALSGHTRPKNGQEGLLAKVAANYGVDLDVYYSDAFQDKSVTAKEINDQLDESAKKQGFTHSVSNTNDVITGCITIFDVNNPKTGGRLFSSKAGTFGQFETTALKNNKVPSWLKQYLDEYPDTKVFRMTADKTALKPVKPVVK